MRKLAILLAVATVAMAALTANAEITFDGSVSWNKTAGTGTFDASGSDKLVVAVAGEHHFNNTNGNVNSITYNGQNLIKAVDRDPVEGNVTATDIWYLDAPASYVGDGTIVVSFSGNNWAATAIGLSGTADGVAATAVASDIASVDITTTASGSMVIAALGMGGAGNTGDASTLTFDPLTKIDGAYEGPYEARQYAALITGYASVNSPGTQTLSFDTAKTDVATIAAEFAPFEDPMKPDPAHESTIIANASLTLSWTNLVPADANDAVTVDVWFGSDPCSLSQIADDTANNYVDGVDASVAGGTYYWRVDSTIGSDANAITGMLWNFTTTDDPAPKVSIETPSTMTWSTEPVQLDATVTDTGDAALTFGWIAESDVADPNLITIDFDPAAEDPIVTVINTSGSKATVTMTLYAFDEVNVDEVEASVIIEVYNDACDMAVNGEGATIAKTDLNGDCITNILDLAEMAAEWLVDIASPSPMPK